MRHAVAVIQVVSLLKPRRMKLLIKMTKRTKHLNEISLRRIKTKMTPKVTNPHQNLMKPPLTNQRRVKISKTVRNQTVKYQTTMTILKSQIQKEMAMRIASGKLVTVRNPGVSLLTPVRKRQDHLMLIKKLEIIKAMMLTRTLIRKRLKNNSWTKKVTVMMHIISRLSITKKNISSKMLSSNLSKMKKLRSLRNKIDKHHLAKEMLKIDHWLTEILILIWTLFKKIGISSEQTINCNKSKTQTGCWRTKIKNCRVSTEILTIKKDSIVIIDVITMTQKVNFLKPISKLGRSTDEINTNKATEESRSTNHNTMSKNNRKKSSWMVMDILNMMKTMTLAGEMMMKKNSSTWITTQTSISTIQKTTKMRSLFQKTQSPTLNLMQMSLTSR